MSLRIQVRSALALAISGIGITAVPAVAQDASAPVQQLQRVEITGSAIKRIDAETAVPVTVLKADDLKKQGISSVEQIIAQLGSSQMSQGTSQGVGSATGGSAFANLRGLGQNKTLVLLNGRRLANNAADASAPDLNMIPFAALERVEVLRDGASALYGTDAIGGVINFITRRDYHGGVVTIGADQPQHDGGRSSNANLGLGFGDLGKDRYNIFGFLDYQRQEPLSAGQRPDILARSLKTSSSTSPGQYNQGGVFENPSYPTCGAPDGIPQGSATNGDKCGYLYARKVDLIPTSERKTGYIKGTFQLTDAHQLGLEYFVSRNTNSTLIAGVPYAALSIDPGTKYYPGNGITPAPTTFVLDPTMPVATRWRDTFSGGRAETTYNTQQRAIASLEGTLAGWDYKTGLAYNSNELNDYITGGYTNGDIVTAGVANGTINPFGPQDAAGATLLASALDKGNLWNAKGTVYSLDGQVSRELGDWLGAGRPAAIAVGAEFRHETYHEAANPVLAAELVASTGYDPATNDGGSRNVFGIYTELNVPLRKDLEVTGSLRYDRYSDSGDTVNPKASFRYQPVQQVLVRGSYSTGFRAPSLFELHTANVYTNTANTWDDPVLCPGGVPIAGANASAACGNQFLLQSGGNPNLKPEKSQNLTLGLVLEPINALTVSIDLWAIELKNQIFALPDTTLFGDPATYASAFHRAPDGTLSFDGSQCPGANCGYIEDHYANHGNAKTQGVDLGVNYRMKAGGLGAFTFDMNGTYVNKFKYQNDTGGPYFNNVGAYGNGVALSAGGGGPVFRWQHSLSVIWAFNSLAAGITNHYKTGYIDQDPTNTVASYTTWDIFGSWAPAKGFGLTLGLRNVFDRAPPYSNQAATFQVGYDPRFADALGRVAYARGSYTF